MNIGIDVDGVLLEIESYQLEYGARYFKKKHGVEIQNKEGFSVRDIFCCSQKEERAFWTKHIWKLIVFSQAHQSAARVVNILRDEKHRIYIFTSRVYANRKGFLGWLSRFILKNWLKRNGIMYDEMLCCSERNSANEKSFLCKTHNIDIMLEDSPENIMLISEITKVMCFDAGYNRSCEGENIMRVKDWDEVHTLIIDMSL